MISLSKHLKQSIDNMKSDPMLLNHVLAVVKPGNEKIIGELCNRFKESGYDIIKTTVKLLTFDEAKELYKVHAKEDFYEDLCKYMSSGPTTAFILKKTSDNIFKEFEKLKEDIRNQYGESDMRNVLHSSDSYLNFTHEAGIYFYNVNQNDISGL